MSEQKKSRPFLRGLAVLLPSVLTLWLLVKAYQFIDSAIAEPINRGIRAAFIEISSKVIPVAQQFGVSPSQEAIEQAAQEQFVSMSQTDEIATITHQLLTNNVDTWWAEHPYMNFVGLIVAAFIVYICGRLVGGFLGRSLYKKLEQVMSSIPVISKIYPYVKQLVDFLISDSDKPKFSRVVAVEYPRKGIWSVGFLTGESMNSLQSKLPDSVTVFVPSSPTPFTGYTITIPRSEIIDLPITVEEAIRFAVSGGVLKPEHQLNGEDAGSELPDRIEDEVTETSGSGDSCK